MNATVAPIPAWKRALPNVLTGGRLVLACTFVVVLQRWKPITVPLTHPDWVLLTATVMFIVAALTDFVDGYLSSEGEKEEGCSTSISIKDDN